MSSTTRSVAASSMRYLLGCPIAAPAHRHWKRPNVEWLCEIAGESRRHESLLVARHGVRGQRDDGYGGRLGLRPQALQRRHAVEVGELDVQQDQPGLNGARQGKALARRSCDAYLVAVELQH